jgi:cytochrome c-type biogenesis protein CcmH
MDQDAARTVRRPPKPNATPSMSPAARDEMERGIRCQCGCTLDVYTCRTTDFNCRVSPAMHRDILSLVEGGYSAEEIVAAFVDTYGERALMAPTTEGFNLMAWVAPFAALAVGGAVLVTLLRRWKARAAARAVATIPAPGVAATDDEMRRLEAAIRDDS